MIEWARLTFPTYREEMKSIHWGGLYDEFKGQLLDTQKLESEIKTLMMDDDVTAQKGIYPYVSCCPKCNRRFVRDMEADHITPRHLGGKTIPENCHMLRKDDNRRKSGK